MISPGALELNACVVALDGGCMLKGTRRGSVDDAEETGSMLADELISQGAGKIIDSLLGASSALVSPP